MTDASQLHEIVVAHAASRPRLRLQTLIKLRWLAVIGQLAAVLIISVGLGYPTPVYLCMALIVASAWLNLFLSFRYPNSLLLDESAAFGLLCYDLLQLGLLLYLTGGLQNPFSIMLLVPVVVSASSQPVRWTLSLGLIAVAIATLLVVFNQPLPWRPGETLNLPIELVAGMWVAIVSSIAFTAVYAFRVAEEARRLADALTATELVLQREQHLSALDGIAAAAAHELGTPLATIALVSKEMLREIEESNPLHEDAKLLRSQAERCRDILQTLTSLSKDGENHIGAMPLTSLIEEVVSPHRDFGVALNIETRPSESPEPVGRRDPGVMYGLGNLIENAVDFANSVVDVTTRWDETSVEISIIDDGPGFSGELLARIGEPFMTTRSRSRDPDASGLGLGLFIAKTLLERSGAQLTFANRTDGQLGATISVVWPMDRFVRESTAIRDEL
ncbi:MAG: ActS/PrrB/RegB family redox-sensitive histidine kinase [Pseudomonadota bacterium]